MSILKCGKLMNKAGQHEDATWEIEVDKPVKIMNTAGVVVMQIDPEDLSAIAAASAMCRKTLSLTDI